MRATSSRWGGARSTSLLWMTLSLILAVGSILLARDLADDLYASALAQERHLRTPGATPPLRALRSTIADYEAIVERFPASSLHDHALWHGANLAGTAYELYREPHDRDVGLRLLSRLAVDRPNGAFASRIPAQRRHLLHLSRVAWLHALDPDVGGTRSHVTLTLDRPASFEAHDLPESNLVYVDLLDTDVAAPLRGSSFDFDTALLSRVRLEQFPGHVSRIVLYTAGTASCATHHLSEPFRLVIDCERPAGSQDLLEPEAPARRSDPTAPRASPSPRLATTTDNVAPGATGYALSSSAEDRAPDGPDAEDYSLARQLGLGISRIVIDPGHGGHDPGARASHLTEADVVLDIALRLERRLLRMEPPVKVVLTRRDDRYLPLETRRILAQDAGADLFVSIHANASENREARGIETYVLNLASDARAQSTAARENLWGQATMQHLQQLLDRMASTSHTDESLHLAHTLQSSTLRALRTLTPDLPDLGVKHAPFVVLIGAQMPSVLVEVSFITNEHDAALLETDAYRELIAEALYNGLSQYRDSLHDLSGGAVAAADGL